MKITVEMSPEEMRKLLGWPDVSEVQDKAIKQLLDQMVPGAEGYDPMSIVQPFLSQSTTTMEQFQKTMADMLGGFASNNNESGKKE